MERNKRISIVAKTCNICREVKEKSEFEKYQQKCISCKDLIRCSICKNIKHKDEFRNDSSRTNHKSSRCKVCDDSIIRPKNEAYYIRRRNGERNRRRTPIRKLREFFRDCLKRLQFDKTDSTWKLLGFTKEEFKIRFPEIPNGYHIDHCIPLSWFKEDTPINISCSLDNLQLLSAEINSRKSNLYSDFPSSEKYLNKILPNIKMEFKEKFCTFRADWVGIGKEKVLGFKLLL